MTVLRTLDVVTTLDLAANVVLSAAIDANLTGVVVIGYRHDGTEYFASSYGDVRTPFWLAERLQRYLLNEWEAKP
jgi:hypothetical protein